jgi:predicted Zn-dependent peptidase
MLEELAKFAEHRVTGAELDQGRNYLAGQAAISRQSGAAVAGEMVDAWLAGEGLEELANPGERYRHVTAEEVRAVAEAYLTGARAEGVIRGKA